MLCLLVNCSIYIIHLTTAPLFEPGNNKHWSYLYLRYIHFNAKKKKKNLNAPLITVVSFPHLTTINNYCFFMKNNLIGFLMICWACSPRNDFHPLVKRKKREKDFTLLGKDWWGVWQWSSHYDNLRSLQYQMTPWATLNPPSVTNY